MSGFQITITDAGRAALINAQNNGTVAFVLSQVGVSTQHIAVNLPGLTQLPNERKRLATMAGDVVADDTLHVTIRDEGDDAYAVRAFGIYTSAGVLFAVYSQPEPILEKSAAAMLLLAVDARLVALGTAMVEFGPADFSLPPASETLAGVVEIATDAEVDAGLDPWRVITARTLKRALSALAGFAQLGHKHDATDTTSGVFHAGRIPALDMTKITGLAMALAGKAAEVHNHTINQITGLTEALLGKAAAIHQHAADDIISGVLAVGRIPALGMEKITGLANALAAKAAVMNPEFQGISWFGANRPGKVNIQGADDRAGIVEFYGTAGRIGFIGYGDGPNGNPYFGTDGDRVWNFQVRPAFAGKTPWDSDNFNPNAKANLASPDFTGSVRLPSNSVIKKEGPGTGEGGQLVLEKPDFSNLGSNVAIDIQGNSLRVWEMGGAFKGVAIDLSLMPGPGTPILTAVDLATGAEAVSGASPSKAITPAALWSFAKSIGPSGYAQIPGTPIIMQWGSSSASLIEGQVTALLPIAFGGGCFFAAATPRNANGDAWADFMMQVVAKYLDRITFYAQRGYDGRNTSSGFEWLALGFATGTPNAVYSAGGGTGGVGGGGELNPEL